MPVDIKNGDIIRFIASDIIILILKTSKDRTFRYMLLSGAGYIPGMIFNEGYLYSGVKYEIIK